MKYHQSALALLLLALSSFPSIAATQRTMRVVPTVTDMLAVDPRSLAASTVGDSSDYLAVVVTTGDTVAGSGSRTWIWKYASSAATNSIAAGGPLAYPWGFATGRWESFTDLGGTAGTATNAPAIVADMATLVNLAYAGGDHPTMIQLMEYWPGTKKGGGTWRLWPSSTAATNFARIAVFGGGRYEPVWPNGKIDPCMFGAKGDGATDDTAAILAAANESVSYAVGNTVLIPGFTNRIALNTVFPVGLRMEFEGPRAMWEAISYPSASYLATNTMNALAWFSSDSVIQGNGARVNQRMGTLTPTAYEFAAFGAGWGKNVKILGFEFTNTFSAPIWFRYITNWTVAENNFQYCPTGPRFYSTQDGLFNHNRIRLWSATPGFTPTVMVFQGGKANVAVNNYLPDNYSTNAVGEFLTGFNFWGEQDPVIERNDLGNLNTSSALWFGGLVLDNCVNYTARGNKIRWNMGSSVMLSDEGGRGGLIEGNYFQAEEQPMLYNPGSTSIGIYLHGEPINDLDKPAEGIVWGTPGYQERGRSKGSELMVVNNRVNGFNVGLELCSSHTRVRFNDFSGNRNAGIRVQGSPALISQFNAKRFPTNPYDLDFFRNDLQNNGNAGILVGGGRYVRFDENWMGNNDSLNQGYSGFQTYYSKGPTSVGALSTTSLINTSGLVANTYENYTIYIPALGISTKVTGNTATTISLSPALTADPNGYTYVLASSLPGEWFVGKNYFFDNGTDFSVENNSLNPTQDISVAGTPFFVDSPQAEYFKQGQVVTLVGVLEGPANLTAKVSYFDKKYPDRIWFKAITNSTGNAEIAVTTPFIQTAGTAITAGTGTISSASTYTLSKDPGVALPLVGSGTAFTTQMDRRAWVKANSEWFKITRVTTDTAAYSDGRISAPFSGQSFVISTFTITGTRQQNRGLQVINSPIKLYRTGEWLTDDNAGFSGVFDPQNNLDTATALDAIPRLPINNANPKIKWGGLQRSANTTNTTYVGFQGQWTGRDFTWIVDDANSKLDLTLPTVFRPTNTVDKALSQGTVVKMTFVNGLWLYTLAEP